MADDAPPISYAEALRAAAPSVEVLDRTEAPSPEPSP